LYSTEPHQKVRQCENKDFAGSPEGNHEYAGHHHDVVVGIVSKNDGTTNLYTTVGTGRQEHRFCMRLLIITNLVLPLFAIALFLNMARFVESDDDSSYPQPPPEAPTHSGLMAGLVSWSALPDSREVLQCSAHEIP
jgi:hypothetical protein